MIGKLLLYSGWTTVNQRFLAFLLLCRIKLDCSQSNKGPQAHGLAV